MTCMETVYCSVMTRFTLISLLFGTVLWIGCEREKADDLDPEEFCLDECERRREIDCEEAESFLENCEESCLRRYENHPQCTDELKAMDFCMQEKVSYVCEAYGLSLVPTGACAKPGLPCMDCTGDLMSCGF